MFVFHKLQHEEYNQGVYAFSNDVAILNFATTIVIGGDVQVLTLPANNNNNYAGDTCVISGWGRTGRYSATSAS